MITGTSSGYAVYSFYRLILFEFLFQFVINSKHKHDIGYDKMMTKITSCFSPSKLIFGTVLVPLFHTF